MCLILYDASSCCTSEFSFSTPKSMTMALGHPKCRMMVFCRMCMTDVLVLSRHGRANTNPVAASTAVHIATCPICSEWRLTVIAATVRIALVEILDLSEVDIPAGVFLHPAVGWG